MLAQTSGLQLAPPVDTVLNTSSTALRLLIVWCLGPNCILGACSAAIEPVLPTSD
jgi:hypothetical protein